jgi:hypothetical protein
MSTHSSLSGISSSSPQPRSRPHKTLHGTHRGAEVSEEVVRDVVMPSLPPCSEHLIGAHLLLVETTLEDAGYGERRSTGFVPYPRLRITALVKLQQSVASCPDVASAVLETMSAMNYDWGEVSRALKNAYANQLLVQQRQLME